MGYGVSGVCGEPQTSDPPLGIGLGLGEGLCQGDGDGVDPRSSGLTAGEQVRWTKEPS